MSVIGLAAGRLATSRHGTFARAVVEMLRAWRRRAFERIELSRLNDRDLHDIGVSRSEALAESAKPFWRK